MQKNPNTIHTEFVSGNILHLFFFLEYRSHCSILNERREGKTPKCTHTPSYELMHAEENSYEITNKLAHTRVKDTGLMQPSNTSTGFFLSTNLHSRALLDLLKHNSQAFPSIANKLTFVLIAETSHLQSVG